MKYRFIKNNEYLFPIEKMGQVLAVGSSGYYKWKSKSVSNKLLLKEKIKQQITLIYFASKQRYGRPSITFDMRANRFTKTIESYGVIRSMSRKGNCWDNAVAESFFKSLKTELIYGNKLITKEKMELEIFEYIEIWYNKKRRHSTLNYKT